MLDTGDCETAALTLRPGIGTSVLWFVRQPEAYRNEWLRYGWNWLKETDRNGFPGMPAFQTIKAIWLERAQELVPS